MVDPRVSRFWQAALQSGLLDVPALEACWEGLPPEKRTADAADRRLARQAVAMGKLSLWQAQQLMAGKSTGFKVDKYVLVDRIGQGGMGRVYLARDTRLGRLVALKVLSPERIHNPRAIARFQREAKVGAQLQQENLVRIYDEGESGGVLYLVMEYIEGRNLAQILADQGPIPPSTAARLCRQVALGLDHAHQKGLIHRDVNPANILVTRDGMAKLTDLGLAIDLADEEQVTRDGATVGTFDYVSPEQARHSRQVDGRADIYSLGCTLYHMLSGQVPFPMASLPEKLFAHQLQDPAPLSKLVPGLPPGLEAVVARMMRKAPEERYARPLAVAEALEPFVASGDEHPTPMPLRSASARPGAPTAEATALAPSGSPRSGSAVATASSSSPSPLATPENDLGDRPGPGPRPGPARVVLPELDLGPEVPLSHGLSSPGGSVDAARRRPLRAGLALIAAALAVAVVILALRTGSADPPEPPPRRPPPPAAGASPGPDAESRPAAAGPEAVATAPGPAPSASPSPAPAPASPPEGPGPGQLAVWSAEEGFLPAADLAEAVQVASGRPGAEVVLGDGDAWGGRLAGPLVVTGRGLTLRPAEGARPVIRVEPAAAPWLLAGAGAPLRLRGLTFVVAPGSAGGPEPAPVVHATGLLVLDRCAFRAEAPAAGGRAVRAEGKQAEVVGCWFEGFERAVDLLAARGARFGVEQSIFAGRPSGWAVRVTAFEPRGRDPAEAARLPGPRLALRRCTADAAGLLEVRDGSAATPLEVEVVDSAVRAGALLGWSPAAPGVALPNPDEMAGAVRWSGRGNLYDLGDGPWIVARPPAGPEPLAAAPAGLSAWNERFAGHRESGSLRRAIRFAHDPGPDGPARPADLALGDPGPRPVGADAGQVGP